VRNWVTEHKKQYEEQVEKVNANRRGFGEPNKPSPAFILNGGHVVPFHELLNTLPGRDAVNKLVARYFNEYDPAIRKPHDIVCSMYAC